jgi:hypothetical protein
MVVILRHYCLAVTAQLGTIAWVAQAAARQSSARQARTMMERQPCRLLLAKALAQLDITAQQVPVHRPQTHAVTRHFIAQQRPAVHSLFLSILTVLR